jgi:hypothetical protein
LCGDYKSTVNPQIRSEVYPLPRQEELLAYILNWRYFLKLDINGVYLHLKLDQKTQELLTLNTPEGLLRPLRLNFGVEPATVIFQSQMERLLEIFKDNIAIYVDDVMVGGKTCEEHD